MKATRLLGFETANGCCGGGGGGEGDGANSKFDGMGGGGGGGASGGTGGLGDWKGVEKSRGNSATGALVGNAGVGT
jgi:hypothetical protein